MRRCVYAPGVSEAPVLWHLKVSHYNEKARWALDYKHVPHVRKAAMPGSHQAIAKKLTGGDTFPVLMLDGEAIGDSTRIIEVLESRYPEPALYPSDPVERRRALELEDFFDEELGPHTRLLVVDHLLREPALFLGTFVPDLTGARRLAARAAFPRLRSTVRAGFEIDDDRVALAYDKLRAASERFTAEVQPSGHLVGDAFTVADLTLAALLAPVVTPEQFPYPQPARGHPVLTRARDVLARAGLVAWTRDMYARYRGRSAEIER